MMVGGLHMSAEDFCIVLGFRGWGLGVRTI